MNLKPDIPKIENNKTSEEIEKQKIHDEFMKPFDEKDVLEQFKNHTETDELDVLYVKKLSENFCYYVYGFKEEDKLETKIDFSLVENYKNLKNYKVSASLRFKESVPNTKGEVYWKMKHRFIKSKDDLNISGTDFLKKAEEYFKILKMNSITNAKGIEAYTSQPSVTEWLKKNNFKLRGEKIANPDDYFEYKDGVSNLKDKDNYELIKVWHSTRKYMKDEYIVNKQWRNDENYGDKWKQALNIDTPNVIEIYKNNEIGEHEITQMINKGYIPRFCLEKDL